MPALPLAERIRQRCHCFLNDAIRFALVHLEGTDLVDKLIDHVAQVQRVQHAHAEVDRKLQAWLPLRGQDFSLAVVNSSRLLLQTIATRNRPNGMSPSSES